MVASVFGSESKETTSHPCSEKALPIEPVPEKSSKSLIHIAKKLRIFCSLVMQDTITKEDIEFLKWLDSPEREHYWQKDANGEKVILREGWDKALQDYNKLKKLFDNKTVFYSEERWA